MTDSPAPARRLRRWLVPALIASLALNLAVLGLVAGLALKGPPGPPREIGLWRYGAALPDPYRQDLMRALRDARPDWGGDRARLADHRRNLAAALTAEPYDPAAVAAVLASEREILDTLSSRGTALLLLQIDRMDPEARAAYARRLLDPPHKERRKDERRGERDDDRREGRREGGRGDDGGRGDGQD